MPSGTLRECEDAQLIRTNARASAAASREFRNVKELRRVPCVLMVADASVADQRVWRSAAGTFSTHRDGAAVSVGCSAELVGVASIHFSGRQPRGAWFGRESTCEANA